MWIITTKVQTQNISLVLLPQPGQQSEYQTSAPLNLQTSPADVSTNVNSPMCQAHPDIDSLGPWGYLIHCMGQNNSNLLVTGAYSLSKSTFDLRMSTMKLTMGIHHYNPQILKMTMTDLLLLVNQYPPKIKLIQKQLTRWWTLFHLLEISINLKICCLVPSRPPMLYRVCFPILGVLWVSHIRGCE